MRILLILWAVPLVLFWTWFGLSAYDISFGTVFFSRHLHDVVFAVYGNALGVPAQDVAPMAAWACLFDSGIIALIAAFRWRARWLPQTMRRAERHLAALRARGGRRGQDAFSSDGASGPTLPAE